LDREEFIERQASFQFGTCSAPAQLDPQIKSRFISTDPALREPKRLKDGRTRRRARRTADLWKEMHQLGLRSPIISRMSDAIQVVSPFPTFQYNRLTGTPNSILWPLRKVHALESESFCGPPDPDEIDLAQKKPVVFWRGKLTGFSRDGKQASHLVEAFAKNEIGRDELIAHLVTIPRYVFVSRYFDADGFDVGFVNHTGDMRDMYGSIPEIARYHRPFATHAEQLEFKYLMSIRGHDVGTSFGWQLASKSVLLKENYSWEVFFDCHLRPWEHFVPVEPDFTDVPEKVAWCEANPDACAAMVENRRQVVPLLIDPDVRREALKRVVERYDSFYERWAANGAG
jgi:Glycosyl transferase family 90